MTVTARVRRSGCAAPGPNCKAAIRSCDDVVVSAVRNLPWSSTARRGLRDDDCGADQVGIAEQAAVIAGQHVGATVSIGLVQHEGPMVALTELLWKADRRSTGRRSAAVISSSF